MVITANNKDVVMRVTFAEFETIRKSLDCNLTSDHATTLFKQVDAFQVDEALPKSLNRKGKRNDHVDNSKAKDY
jgi:hypothetical protein